MKSCKTKTYSILYTFFTIMVFSFYLINLAVAAEFCVDTSAGLQSALTDAETNGEDDIIKVQQGTYLGNFPYSSTQANSLTIEGGYNHPKCKKRVVDFTNTVLDAQNTGRVLTLDCSSVAADLILDGITVQNGNVTVEHGGGLLINTSGGNTTISNNSIVNNANDSTNRSGGGVYIYGSDEFTMNNCSIMNNTARFFGGGIYIERTNIVNINQNIIKDNSSTDRDGGGGVVSECNSVNISQNTIMNNLALSTTYGSVGGIYLTGGNSLNFINNNVVGNRARVVGGGAYIYGYSNSSIQSNFFSNNGVNYEGGAIAVAFGGESSIVNNVIYNNNAGGGGGIFINLQRIIVANNTIVSNSANVYDPSDLQNGKGGGIKMFLVSDSDRADIYNNVIFNNFAEIIGHDFHIHNDENGNNSPSPVYLYNNDFNQSDSGTWIQITFPIDSSNLDNVDPLFDIDGYHLTDSSPCIDAGMDAGVYDDIDGDSRPQGVGYDIGADEFVGTSEILDLDIARFTVTKRVSLNSNKNTVEISLAVVNDGIVDNVCPATVVGMQDSNEVYNETIEEVSDAIGKGATTFDFLPFAPTVVGDIVWTVTVDDDDPDVDEATASTTVNP